MAKERRNSKRVMEKRVEEASIRCWHCKTVRKVILPTIYIMNCYLICFLLHIHRSSQNDSSQSETVALEPSSYETHSTVALEQS